MISTVWYHCVKNSSFSLCWEKNGLTRGRKVRSTCSAGYPSDHSSLIASLRLTSTFTFFSLIKSILSCQTVKVWPLKQVACFCLSIEHATSLCRSYSDSAEKLQAEFRRQSFRGEFPVCALLTAGRPHS